MPAPDCVTVTAIVEVDPETAFRIFTEEVDLWWKRGPRFRFRPGQDGTLRFEPGEGGRFVEIYDEVSGDAYEIGRILSWEPGKRLLFECKARKFERHQVTVVEVQFESTDGGTRVTVNHRGWDAIPADHPARRGMVGEAFEGMMGLWWADQLVMLKSRAKGVE